MSTNFQKVGYTDNSYLPLARRTNNQKFGTNVSTNDPNDAFVSSNIDSTNDGKFTAKEALKDFGKGAISPITTMIKHPIASLGMIAGTVALCAAAPVLGPVMAIGFSALSVFQVAKGGITAISEYKKGNYDNAEKAFQDIGSGVVGTVLTALGIKQSAKVASEAKTMSQLNTTVLNSEQKDEIATKISSGSWFNALKENFSLLTSKDGLKAVGYQLKPSMVKERLTDVKNIITHKKVEQKIPQKTTVKHAMTIEEFKKSEEGLRRAGLSEEQIKEEAQALFDKAFDEKNISKQLRPNLKIEKGQERQGGSYNAAKHEIVFNPESYKSGVFEIDDVIMHEATHCEEALLRARLPQDKVDTLTKEALINRIKNGESEKILKQGNFLGAETMDPPKIPAGMKDDFAQFAEDVLYTKDNSLQENLTNYSNYKKWLSKKTTTPERAEEYQQRLSDASEKLKPVTDRLNEMIDKNPDFAAQYKNKDEALTALMDYSLSHNVRYNYFSNAKIKGIDQNVLPELTPEQAERAIKSFDESITTVEGNVRISGFNGIFAGQKDFNQYQFSPEEVKCQLEGNKFLIKNLTNKMQKMKEAGNLSTEQEAYLQSVINKANTVIEYKNKGLEYYEAYTKLLHNPNDAELAQKVKTMEAELETLNETIHNGDMEEVITYITQLVSPDHASINLPLNLPVILTTNKQN